MVVLVLFAALAINIGEWYDTDSGLQRAADLSAIAGAQYLATGGSLTTAGYPCTVGAGVTNALQCADRVAKLNGMTGAETDSPSFVNGNQGIKVVTSHPNEGGIFFNSSRQESATAIVGGIAGASNSFPATFQQQSWVPGTQVNFVFGTAQVPGAFNLIQACGSNGGSGSPSEQQLITCFKCAQTYTIASDNSLVPRPLPNGCGNVTPLCTGDTIGSDPGNNLNNNVINAINTLSTFVVLIPAYDTASGSGNNATYHVVGFAEMQLANPAAQQVGSGNNKSIQITGTFVQELAPSDVQGTCSGTGQNLGSLTYYLVS
jgi:hypothetical protein